MGVTISSKVSSYIKSEYGNIRNAKRVTGISSVNELKAYVAANKIRESNKRGLDQYVRDRLTQKDTKKATSIRIANTVSEAGSVKQQGRTINNNELALGVNDVNKQQSRYVTTSEQFLKGYAPQSTVKENTFGREGTTVYVPLERKKPLSIEEARSKNVSSAVKDYVSKKEKALTGSKKEFESFVSEQREIRKKLILDKPPAYGSFEQRDFGQVGLGVFSKGFQIVGEGATAFIREQELREERKNYFKTNFGGGGGRGDVDYSIAKGLVEGGVTRLGESKTDLFITSGAGVLGAGYKGSEKLITKGVTFVKGLKGGKTALNIGKYGVIGGGGGYLTFDVAISNNKEQRVGEIIGEGLRIGAAFETGGAATTGIKSGLSNIKTGVQTLRAKSFIGKELTVSQRRTIANIAKGGDVSLEVRGMPVEKVSYVESRSTDDFLTRKASKTSLELGDLQKVDPSLLDKPVVIDYEANLKIFGQSASNKKVGVTSSEFLGKNVKGTTPPFSSGGFERTFGSPQTRTSIEPSFGSKKGIGSIKFEGTPRIATEEELGTFYTGGRKGGGVLLLDQKNFLSGGTKQLTGNIKPSFDFEIIGEIVPTNTKYFTNARVTSAKAAPKTKVIDIGDGTKITIIPSVTTGTVAGSSKLLLKTKPSIEISTEQKVKTETRLSTKTETKSLNKQKIDLDSKYSATNIKNDVRIDLASIGVEGESVGKVVSKVDVLSVGKTKTLSFTGSSFDNINKVSTRRNIKSDVGIDNDTKIITGVASISNTDSNIASRVSIASDTTNKVDSLLSSDSIVSSKSITSSNTGIKIDGLAERISQKSTSIFPPKIIFGKSDRKREVFSAFAKVRGKFRFVGQGRSSSEAASIGSSFVRGRSSATFGVSKAGSEQFIDLDSPRGFYKKKTKKGSVFIEYNKNRINTGGELGEITFKGIASQKRRGGIF